MLKKILFFTFFFLMLYSFSLAQTDDSLISPSNPPEAETSYVEESLADKVCSLFTTNQIFSSEYIENSIYRSLGDVLKKNRVMDVTSYGPYGQPEYATIWGGTSRQFLIYQDGIPFSQEALYVPKAWAVDLFTVPIENIENIQIIDNPVANILGRNTGLGGLRIKTKEYKTERPFSRINFERGPFGYRRTQLDFGRDLSRKIGFYFTGGWKKSDGYITNSNFESIYLTGNFLYKMRENWKIGLRLFHYENRSGNPLPYNPWVNLRIKEDRTALHLNSDYFFKNNTFLKIEVLYSSNPSETSQGGYFLDREKKETESYLKGSYDFKWNNKNQAKVELFLSKEKLTIKGAEKSSNEEYLSYLNFLEISSKCKTFLFLRLNRDEKFDWSLSGLGGISYRPNEGLTLFSIFSRAFANPTLSDQYLERSSYSIHSDSTYFSYQEYYEPFLKNEALNSGDAGFSWTKKDFKLRGSLFYSLNQDNLEWTFSKTVDRVSPYTYIRYQYIPSNRERKLFGLNLNFDYIFSPNFEASFSYAYKRARADSFPIPYVPEHSFFSYFQYSCESSGREYGLKFRLEQKYISRRYLADYNQDQVPFVLLFNSKISLRFLDFCFYYVMENLTDERYRTRGDFDMPGRALWFGFSWDFYD